MGLVCGTNVCAGSGCGLLLVVSDAHDAGNPSVGTGLCMSLLVVYVYNGIPSEN